MKNIIILLGCILMLIVACSGYNPSNPNNINYTTMDKIKSWDDGGFSTGLNSYFDDKQ